MAVLTATQARRARPTLPEFRGEAAVYRHPSLGGFPCQLTGREYAPEGREDLLFFEVRLRTGTHTWVPAGCLYLAGSDTTEGEC